MLKHDSKSRFYIFRLAMIGMCVAGLSACATTNPELVQARDAYAQAAGDEQIRTQAPIHLQEAEKLLQKAEKASDDKDVGHYAYLAKKNVEIARNEAQRKSAEEEISDLQKGRQNILLTARTREANEANRKAENAQEMAQEAQKRAEDSEKQATQAKEDSARSSQYAQSLEKDLSDLQARQTKRGLEMTIQGALFEVGKADLKPGAVRHLEKLIDTMKENPKRQALIEGYTDSTGSEEFNLMLSEKRAKSVANFLENSGVDPSRIIARGYGESYPVVSNKTPAGRLQNRRVEVIILNEGEKASARN